MSKENKDYSKRIYIQRIIFIVLVLIFVALVIQFAYSDSIRFQGNTVHNLLTIDNTENFKIIKNNTLKLNINEFSSTFIATVNNIDDFNGPSRYTQKNINNGSNASSGIIIENNIGERCTFGIGSSNFTLLGLSLPGIPGILCFVDRPFIFVNSFPFGWQWIKQDVGSDSLSEDPGDYTTVMDLSGDGNLTISGNFFGNQIYGEMFTNEGSTPTTFSSSGVFFPVVNDLEIGSNNGFTFSGGNLTVLFSGIYKASYGISYTGSNNNDIKFTIGINGTSTPNCQTEGTIDGGGIIIASGMDCFINVSAGDTVQLMAQNIGATQPITIEEANINLLRIGG